MFMKKLIYAVFLFSLIFNVVNVDGSTQFFFDSGTPAGNLENAEKAIERFLGFFAYGVSPDVLSDFSNEVNQQNLNQNSALLAAIIKQDKLNQQCSDIMRYIDQKRAINTVPDGRTIQPIRADLLPVMDSIEKGVEELKTLINDIKSNLQNYDNVFGEIIAILKNDISTVKKDNEKLISPRHDTAIEANNKTIYNIETNIDFLIDGQKIFNRYKKELEKVLENYEDVLMNYIAFGRAFKTSWFPDFKKNFFTQIKQPSKAVDFLVIIDSGIQLLDTEKDAIMAFLYVRKGTDFKSKYNVAITNMLPDYSDLLRQFKTFFYYTDQVTYLTNLWMAESLVNEDVKWKCVSDYMHNDRVEIRKNDIVWIVELTEHNPSDVSLIIKSDVTFVESTIPIIEFLNKFELVGRR